MTSTSAPRIHASELLGRGWLNTGGRDIHLADLRGKIVVLDFWTFCCINCLHVLDELRTLEEAHRAEVVIIGVHSPKFVHEADPQALAAAVERYDVRHPVLDDPDLVTWSAYTARAWPTLVVIDPEGYIVAQMAGEGHARNLEILVRDLIAEHDAKGTLHRGSGPYIPAEPTPGTLRFPAKAVTLESGNLLVADAGHHSLAELAPDGETLVRRIGSGQRGFSDGGTEASFSEPNGLCLVPVELRETLGYDVLVADTVNHALRGVRLADGFVTTVAGTGDQLMVGGATNVPEPGLGARGTRLTSPWDVQWAEGFGGFLVAMAGNHTLWAFDAADGTIEQIAGTMNEGLLDGPLPAAWFAQPSGLAVRPDGQVWVADSETSALRVIAAGTEGGRDGAMVRTMVGQGLFDFGYRDGPADQALLQHPLGVAALPDGSVLIADTYNGALRRYDPEYGEVTTIATGLAEPSGVVVQVFGDQLTVLVVESAAHRLARVALPAALTGQLVDNGAHRTRRPVTDIPAGDLVLEVVFTPATGQKYDDRYGPSAQLTVSATPPELLLAGAGTAQPLIRRLRINPEVTEGVLHVTAQAASCDADPAIEYPACHLAQQDWGVPVRVFREASPALVLTLHG